MLVTMADELAHEIEGGLAGYLTIVPCGTIYVKGLFPIAISIFAAYGKSAQNKTKRLTWIHSPVRHSLAALGTTRFLEGLHFCFATFNCLRRKSNPRSFDLATSIAHIGNSSVKKSVNCLTTV